MEQLDNDNFQRFILNRPRVVVEFWAPWHGPSVQMHQIMQQVQQTFQWVAFARANFDECFTAVQQYNVKPTTTLLFFRDGNLVSRLAGPQSQQTVEKWLKPLIS